MLRNLWQRIRFEPVVVRGVIVSVALLFGSQLDAAAVDQAIAPWFVALSVLGPLAGSVWARFKTRSKASLQAEGVL